LKIKLLLKIINKNKKKKNKRKMSKRYKLIQYKILKMKFHMNNKKGEIKQYL
jgi:hypothetical protein